MPADDEILTELRGRITAAVAEGFDARDEMIERFTEYVQGEYDREDLAEAVEQLTDTELAAHRHRQAKWAGPTDCDRLDRAFADLEDHGVVARQHFT
jgi:hypothetical protein